MAIKRKSFWEQVDTSAGILGCWPWVGLLWTNGYGMFCVGKRKILAHRRAFEFWYGEIPKGKLILHSCDCRPCCNPLHHIPGTHKENTQDMIRKGRHAHGETHGSRTCPESLHHGERSPFARYSAEQVLEVRRLAACGGSIGWIALTMEMSSQNVSAIVARRTWKYLLDDSIKLEGKNHGTNPSPFARS